MIGGLINMLSPVYVIYTKFVLLYSKGISTDMPYKPAEFLIFIHMFFWTLENLHRLLEKVYFTVED